MTRRRRLTIAAVALLVLGGGLWSTRPKIDPRLVGRWESDDNWSGPFEWRFASDGTCTTVEKVTLRDGSERPRAWKVDGNTLLVASTPTRVFGRRHELQIQLEFGWTRLTRPDTAYRRYEIVEVTPNRLKLRTDDGSVYPYHRLAADARPGQYVGNIRSVFPNLRIEKVRKRRSPLTSR